MDAFLGFYIAYGTPVKIEKTDEGGLRITALDKQSGEFKRDNRMLSLITSTYGDLGGDIQKITEEEFLTSVAQARMQRAAV